MRTYSFYFRHYSTNLSENSSGLRRTFPCVAFLLDFARRMSQNPIFVLFFNYNRYMIRLTNPDMNRFRAALTIRMKILSVMGYYKITDAVFRKKYVRQFMTRGFYRKIKLAWISDCESRNFHLQSAGRTLKPYIQYYCIVFELSSANALVLLQINAHRALSLGECGCKGSYWIKGEVLN